MNRLLRHYDPRMPIYLIRKAEAGKFDPETFISWYLTYPDISDVRSLSASKHASKFRRYLIYFAYYLWVLYLVSVIMMLFYAPFIAVAGFIASPFIVAGALYALLYAVWLLKRMSPMPKPKAAAKNSPNKNRSKRSKR